MLVRMQNPLRDLTREQKILLGVGAGAVLAVATLGVAAWAAQADPEPPKPPLEVGAACATYSIVSEQQLRDELRTRLRAAAHAGPIDPLTVTGKYLRTVAPECPTYPSKAQNPGQVRLFAEIYLLLLEVMQQENFLSAADFPTWYGMMTTWAAGQGVPPEEL